MENNVNLKNNDYEKYMQDGQFRSLLRISELTDKEREILSKTSDHRLVQIKYLLHLNELKDLLKKCDVENRDFSQPFTCCLNEDDFGSRVEDDLWFKYVDVYRDKYSFDVIETYNIPLVVMIVDTEKQTMCFYPVRSLEELAVLDLENKFYPSNEKYMPYLFTDPRINLVTDEQLNTKNEYFHTSMRETAMCIHNVSQDLACLQNEISLDLEGYPMKDGRRDFSSILDPEDWADPWELDR